MELELEFISLCIAGGALIISLLCYFENRRIRIEHGEAYLIAELMQIDSKLYIMISNIGNSFAHNLQISMSEPFVNVFENIKTIRPGCSYRYCLLDNNNISTYSEIIEIVIKYQDYYTSMNTKEKIFSYNLTDYLKFDIMYNQHLSCYDISKSF